MINKRLDLGMDDVEWGDVWWVVNNKIPVDMYKEYSNQKSENLRGHLKFDSKKYDKVKKIDGNLRKIIFEQKRLVLDKISLITNYKQITFGSLIDFEQERNRVYNQIYEQLYTNFPKINVKLISKRAAVLTNYLIDLVENALNSLLSKGFDKDEIVNQVNSFYKELEINCLHLVVVEVELLTKQENIF